MRDELRALLSHVDVGNFMRNFAVFSSFALPILILYLIYPTTFEITWRGRAQLLIFLWLFTLELALAWRELSTGWANTHLRLRKITSAALLTIPTVYVLLFNLEGTYELPATSIRIVFSASELRSSVVELGKILGIPYNKFGSWLVTDSWPLSFEYIVLTVSFTATILAVYSFKGLKKLSLASFFLTATTLFYLLDTFNPFGAFAILQAFVPFTASSAATVLNLMGYKTLVMSIFDSVRGPGTILVSIAEFSSKKVYFPVAIYWPSAGIHSLFIYTIAILLFVRNSGFGLKSATVRYAVFSRLGHLWRNQMPPFLRCQIVKHACNKAGMFVVKLLRLTPIYIVVVVGAVGTFIANVLRIATISSIGLQVGTSAAQHFHDYWGELFFITWMLIYLLALFLTPKLAAKLSSMIRKRNLKTVITRVPDQNSFDLV